MSGSSSGSWAGAPPDILDLDRFMRGARPEPSASDRTRRRGGGLVVDGGASVSSGSSTGSVRRDKRFSHDSGLSDGSYGERRHRSHRRRSYSESRPRAKKLTPEEWARALRGQQALLCERLAKRRARTSSDASSSSLSTTDPRRKDKRRSDECKTYKLIMSKLDDLNRVFSARARPPKPAPSSFVSVSDKLVGTEPEPVRPEPAKVDPQRAAPIQIADKGSSAAGERGRRLSAVCAATPDQSPRLCPRISAVPCCPSADSSGSAYDLDNPLHMYAQAQRLQAFYATAQCSARSGRSAPAHSAAAPSLCALCRGYARAVRQFLGAQLCWPPV